MTVVFVPVACVKTVDAEETVTSEREAEEATPTGGGGAEPSAVP